MMKLSIRMLCFGIPVVLCLIAGCSSSAHLVIHDKTGYGLNASFASGSLLEKNAAHILNQHNSQSIFNRDELQRSLSDAGLNVNDITLKGIMGISVSCTVPHTHQLISEYIRYNQQEQSLSISISPETVHLFLTMIPQESREFIDMLMAPLFTGDAMSVGEYEELIGAAYGKKVAAELRSSEFLVTLDVPYKPKTAVVQPIGSVTLQNRQTGTRAFIRFPLIDLLCTTGTIEIRL